MGRKSVKGQLVTQHLEMVSSELLERYAHVLRRYLRGRHGVYALYKGARLYYVGLASSMRGRLKQHLRDRHSGKWDRFSVYLTLHDRHLHELESLALRIAKPKGNVQKGKFVRSENLEREIRRRFRDEQEAELRELFSRSHKKAELPSIKTKSGNGTLSKYIDGPMKIRFRYKGKVYRGRVLKNGHISLRGKRYSSPSSASSSIVKRPTDGWYCWKFERAPGDWVLLNTLRQ